MRFKQPVKGGLAQIQFHEDECMLNTDPAHALVDKAEGDCMPLCSRTAALVQTLCWWYAYMAGVSLRKQDRSAKQVLRATHPYRSLIIMTSDERDQQQEALQGSATAGSPQQWPV